MRTCSYIWMGNRKTNAAYFVSRFKHLLLRFYIFMCYCAVIVHHFQTCSTYFLKIFFSPPVFKITSTAFVRQWAWALSCQSKQEQRKSSQNRWGQRQIRFKATFRVSRYVFCFFTLHSNKIIKFGQSDGSQYHGRFWLVREMERKLYYESYVLFTN